MNKVFYTHDGSVLTGFYEEGVSPIPEDAVEIDPSKRVSLMVAESKGKRVVMKDGEPVAVDPPTIPSDWAGEKWEPNQAKIKENAVALRRAAFQAETDPMVFDVLAGDLDVGTWKAARQAIKERFPKE